MKFTEVKEKKWFFEVKTFNWEIFAHELIISPYVSFHFVSFRCVWTIALNFLFTFTSFFSFPFIFLFLFGFGPFYYYLLLGGFGFHLFLYNFRGTLLLRLLYLFCTCFVLHDSVPMNVHASLRRKRNRNNGKIDYNRCTCFCRFKEGITFAWGANKSKTSDQHCCSIIAQYGCIDWK